jgi:hypothetical protein
MQNQPSHVLHVVLLAAVNAVLVCTSQLTRKSSKACQPDSALLIVTTIITSITKNYNSVVDSSRTAIVIVC